MCQNVIEDGRYVTQADVIGTQWKFAKELDEEFAICWILSRRRDSASVYRGN